jgi:hypothetical protein
VTAVPVPRRPAPIPNGPALPVDGVAIVVVADPYVNTALTVGLVLGFAVWFPNFCLGGPVTLLIELNRRKKKCTGPKFFPNGNVATNVRPPPTQCGGGVATLLPDREHIRTPIPFVQSAMKLSFAGTWPLSVSLNVTVDCVASARAGEAVSSRAPVTRAHPAPRPMNRFIVLSPSAGRLVGALRGRHS